MCCHYISKNKKYATRHHKKRIEKIKIRMKMQKDEIRKKNEKQFLKNKAPAKPREIIKTWIIQTNLLPRSRDRDNLIEIKTKESNEVYFSKRITSRKENDVNPVLTFQTHDPNQ